ncbi:hypothetical protein Dimus_024152 [Dionaea muscipula]
MRNSGAGEQKIVMAHCTFKEDLAAPGDRNYISIRARHNRFPNLQIFSQGHIIQLLATQSSKDLLCEGNLDSADAVACMPVNIKPSIGCRKRKPDYFCPPSSTVSPGLDTHFASPSCLICPSSD